SPTGEACLDVPGATGLTYLTGSDDVGSTLRVVVTATDELGSGLASSPATDVIAAAAATDASPPPPSVLSVPTITGAATAGETLTADDGVWSGIVDLTRQWQRCNGDSDVCLDIPGATEQTYAARPDDVGFGLRVVVTATDGAGSGAAASNVTGVVADAPAPPAADTPPA